MAGLQAQVVAANCVYAQVQGPSAWGMCCKKQRGLCPQSICPLLMLTGQTSFQANVYGSETVTEWYEPYARPGLF